VLVALGHVNLDREPVVNLLQECRTITNKLVVLLVQQTTVAMPSISQFFGTTRLAGFTPVILECGPTVVCTVESTVTTPLPGCLRILTGTTPGKQHIQLGMAQQVSQPKLFLPILSSLALPSLALPSLALPNLALPSLAMPRLALGPVSLDREPEVEPWQYCRTTTNKHVVLLVQLMSVAMPSISQLFGTTRLAGFTPATLECGPNVVRTVENSVATQLPGCRRILTGTTKSLSKALLPATHSMVDSKAMLLAAHSMQAGSTTKSRSLLLQMDVRGIRDASPPGTAMLSQVVRL